MSINNIKYILLITIIFLNGCSYKLQNRYGARDLVSKGEFYYDRCLVFKNIHTCKKALAKFKEAKTFDKDNHKAEYYINQLEKRMKN